LVKSVICHSRTPAGTLSLPASGLISQPDILVKLGEMNPVH